MDGGLRGRSVVPESGLAQDGLNSPPDRLGVGLPVAPRDTLLCENQVVREWRAWFFVHNSVIDLNCKCDR